MTIRYVGIGGNDGNSGLSWALRKLTLSNTESVPVAAGDIVYVGPGTYRETLTAGVSGGNTYSTGTVSVTAGSAVVTGSGTLFNTSSNVLANYIFHVTVLAHGTDGVAVNAGNHFTSATGNFQAGHVGKALRIGTLSAYIIASVVSATEVTLANTDGTTPSFAGTTGLTYDVGPEQPFDILSVDSNTQLTLKTPWNGPTLTGLAYLTYNTITYIGDYLGTNTDGIGGVVRITGSSNDIALTRANCITGTSKNYRRFQGFLLDGSSSSAVSTVTSCSYWIIDQCYIMTYGAGLVAINLAGTGKGNTIKNCYLVGGSNSNTINITHTSTVNDCANLVQNCIVQGGGTKIAFTRVGGCTVKNCTIGPLGNGITVATALAAGETETVNNCILYDMQTAIQATTNREILEDYNNFIGNNTTRGTGVATGSHSLADFVMPDTRWFFNMVTRGAGPYSMLNLATPFDLDGNSPMVNTAGIFPTTTDMRGTAVQGAQREWGALEYDSTLKAIPGVTKSRVQTGM